MRVNCSFEKLSKGFLGMQFRYKKLKLTKGAFLWGDPSSDPWSKICLDHGASKEPASVFLWDDPSSAQWSKICLDHGASKEPAIPWPEWIRRFLWCTMTQTDLGSLCRTRIIPKECTRRFLWCTMTQTNICPRSEASRANMLVLRTSNFQWATIRPIVPRHKHSIV